MQKLHLLSDHLINAQELGDRLHEQLQDKIEEIRAGEEKVRRLNERYQADREVWMHQIVNRL